MRSGAKTAIAGLAICLPCLLPLLLAAGIGAGAFSALGAWLSSNTLVLGGAAALALATMALGGTIFARRSRAAACDTGRQEAAQASEGSKT